MDFFYSKREDKLSILDIKAKDEQGQYYNIEMQITKGVAREPMREYVM